MAQAAPPKCAGRNGPAVPLWAESDPESDAFWRCVCTHLSFFPSFVFRGTFLKHGRSDRLCRIEFFQFGWEAVGTSDRYALTNCRVKRWQQICDHQ
jgi:hypothetical protein